MSNSPHTPVESEPESLLPQALEPPAEPPPERVVLPAILLLITFGTTTLAGFLLANTIGGGQVSFAQLLAEPGLIVLGLPFSLTLLAILLAHEMGHYLACRYYGIRATLPYVLPAPPIPFGTFGAVIRIKSPFATPGQLFDVGVAGPLAGMLFVVPAAAAGLALSTPLVGEPPADSDFVVSFPLLFRGFVRLFHGPGFMETVHPIACAAWFGSLATAFNLIPIGQLDGGHMTWALFGPHWHLRISRAGWLLLVIAGFALWPGYLVFGVVLVLIGFRHPVPLKPHGRLGSGRIVLALLALASFVLTIVPVPIRIG